MKSSTEAASPANDPAVGALSGDPAATVPAQASGLAGWLQEPDERSATGHRAASPMGQISWAVFEWARNPYVLLVTIYLFAPYFSRVVVGDPVEGQALWGTIASVAGLVVAFLAPLLGAIADAGGKRKPWIGFYVVILAASSLLMWFAMPHSTGLQLVFVGALVVLANTSFEFTQVFHNSLLPTIAPPRRIASLSGLGLALTNAAGVILLTIMLVCFALPEKVQWSFIPDASAVRHQPCAARARKAVRSGGRDLAHHLQHAALLLHARPPEGPCESLGFGGAGRALGRGHGAEPEALSKRRRLSARASLLQRRHDRGPDLRRHLRRVDLRLGPGADDPLWHRAQHLRGHRRIPRRLSRQPPRLQARDLRQHRRHDCWRDLRA